MFAALASDIAITNGFYVWPKLIAAAFLLAALALVISPRWSEWRRDWRIGALLGALLALGMLAHGASIYGIIPLVFVAAFRGLPSWRWIGAAAARRLRDDGLLVGLPAATTTRPATDWSSGTSPASPKSTTAAASRRSSTATAKRGSSGALENKWNNVEDITGIARFNEDVDDTVDAIEDGDASEAIVSIRALPLLRAAPGARPAPDRPDRDGDPPPPPGERGRVELRDDRLRLRRDRASFWALLQWGTPGYSSAIIHAGTLAIPLVAIAACVVGAAAASTRLAIAVVAVNALFVLVALHALADAAAGHRVLADRGDPRGDRPARLRPGRPRRRPAPAAQRPEAALCAGAAER